jgi:hypothetical protein
MGEMNVISPVKNETNQQGLQCPSEEEVDLRL